MSGAEFVPFSLVPLLVGCLAAVSCALPGNFLVLRRQALIGDAISHVVLPGIVVAFLVTGRIETWPMLAGALGAAILAVAMIEAIRRFGRVEAGAAMGVTFTALFAAGVLLLEQSDTSAVHLDVEHALYGNLESLIWLDATGWASLVDRDALVGLPSEVLRLLVVTLVMSILTWIFWRPLTISTFDEGFAGTLGLPVRGIGLGLVVAAAVAAVAAFDAVGSIIVIAMFLCPPAAARLVTNRLGAQVLWSVIFALASAVIGFVLAGSAPLWLGLENAVSAAGMIGTVSGMILGLAALFGPKL